MPCATHPDVNPRICGGGLRFGIRLQGPGETAFFAF